MAATVTLVYDCSVGIQDPNNFVALVAAVNITDELPFLGMSVGADATVVAGGKVQRTIVLDVLPSGNAWFPSDALVAAATVGIYAQKIAQQVPCSVAASAPVVA